VSDIDGNTPRAHEKIGLVMKSRRKLMAISSDVGGLRDAGGLSAGPRRLLYSSAKREDSDDTSP
jgi:hypothetical protein